MNRAEAAELLGLCAAYDRRTVGVPDAMAWADALDDIRLEDAAAVVKAYYRDNTQWLMPATVRTAVKNLRNDRLERTAIPAPPLKLADDPLAAIEWQKRIREQIADGTYRAPELETKPRNMKILENTFRRIHNRRDEVAA